MSTSIVDTLAQTVRKEVWEGESSKPGKKRKCTGGLFYEFKLTWGKFKTLINEAISNSETSLTEVASLAHESQWRKIIVEEEGGYSYTGWLELQTLIKTVKDKLYSQSTISKEKITTLHQKINSKVHTEKTKIKYGIFPCQDTILPLFFEQSYNRNLDVEFVKFNNWSDGLKAFQSKAINIALHNFPTTVAFNSIIGSQHPLFFYPFFSFNGYGLFVKQEAIKRVAKKFKLSFKSTFDDLSPEAKKELFETSKIIVERKTDFEWAVINFSNSLGCDTKTVLKNLIDCNTNEAKNKFLSNTSIGLHCTNPINFKHLESNASKKIIQPILNDDGIGEHHNFNGLICTKEFFEQNVEAVAELIATWFNDIVRLKKELKDSQKATGTKQQKILIPLTDFLNQNISSKIKPEELRSVFAGHNTFYDSPDEAFNKFYHDVLKNDNKIFQNYKEIALIQLEREEDTEDEVSKAINLIKNHMSKL